MKHRSILTAIALLVAAGAFADFEPSYYNGINGKSGEALRTALNGCISGHKTLNYDALEDYYLHTDFRPDGTLWEIYSLCEFTMAEENLPQSNFCDGWNKEHTVPSSWFNKQSPMYSDIFHVLPTDARVNNLRGNEAYGETASRTDEISRSDVALGHKGSSSFPGYTGIGTVYEPDDRYKGDIARIYFYMVTCYNKRDFTKSGGDKMFSYINSTNALTDYSVALLMKWHRQDPVSTKEIIRNDSVYMQQGNRNPFVDFPELAEYIWGTKASVSFDPSTALSAYSKDYVPLDTEGGDIREFEKYGIEWYAMGTKLQTDSVIKNHRPSALPEAGVSCSATSDTFMGWTAQAIAGTSDEAPADLFTTAAEAPVIGENSRFYAVFAHAEQGEGEGSVTAKASFTSADGYSRGDPVTSAKAGKVTLTFDKGTNTNAPKFFTELRCYGGNTITATGATMTKVEFVPGPEDKGKAIKPNTGKMDATGLIWTGEASTIKFTIDDTSGYRGLSAIKVTYDDNTTIFEYSEYMTSCGGATDVVESGKWKVESRKFIRDGRLYIECDGKIYDVMGQEILDFRF